MRLGATGVHVAPAAPKAPKVSPPCARTVLSPRARQATESLNAVHGLAAERRPAPTCGGQGGSNELAEWRYELAGFC